MPRLMSFRLSSPNSYRPLNHLAGGSARHSQTVWRSADIEKLVHDPPRGKGGQSLAARSSLDDRKHCKPRRSLRDPTILQQLPARAGGNIRRFHGICCSFVHGWDAMPELGWSTHLIAGARENGRLGPVSSPECRKWYASAWLS